MSDNGLLGCQSQGGGEVKKEEQSKNERAGLLCGYRKPGLAVMFPRELGYVCPVCGLDTLEGWELLEWSEYHGLLWCPKCNIDIPSCLCVKYAPFSFDDKELTQKEKIQRATDIYLQCIADSLKLYLFEELVKKDKFADVTEEKLKEKLDEIRGGEKRED